jgi:hypothetical protein
MLDRGSAPLRPVSGYKLWMPFGNAEPRSRRGARKSAHAAWTCLYGTVSLPTRAMARRERAARCVPKDARPSPAQAHRPRILIETLLRGSW